MLADLRGPADGRGGADGRDGADGRVPDYPVPGRKNPLTRLLLVAALRIRHGRPVWLPTRRSDLANDRRR